MAQGGSRQKRKRKQRATRQSPSGVTRGYERARRKDDEARAALVPLEPGERPTAVTVGAVVAAISFVANAVALALGPENVGTVVFGMFISGVTAVGMWRARYWAVLGMQTLLGFAIVGSALAVVFANDLLHAGLALLLVAAASTLFWFLVKAMARIQMPRRPGAQKR